MPHRIFIGLTDVASHFLDYRAALEEKGHKVTTGVWQNPAGTFLHKDDYQYVFCPYVSAKWIPVPLKKRLNLWLSRSWHVFINRNRIPEEIIRQHDVFIFVWNSFDRKWRDYEALRKRGKTVIVIFCGDDARWHAGINQEFAELGFPPMHYAGRHIRILGMPIHLRGYDFTLSGLRERMWRIRHAEKHANFIFSKREQAHLQLRPFHHYTMNVDVNRVPHNPVQRKQKPVIVHAPSNPLAKGTPHVMQAFRELKEEGLEFDYVLMQNVPNEQAVQMYRDADIVIDQLIIPGGGKLGTEALAAGCVVMSRMEYDRYPQGLDLSECPIIDVRPESIKEELRRIIPDHERRQSLADRGRPFVVKHWDMRVFCQKILDLLDGKDIPFDHVPTYFRERYHPALPGERTLLNRWTDYVKGSDWYRSFVKGGERDGLRF